jgi:hypothetical protein
LPVEVATNRDTRRSSGTSDAKFGRISSGGMQVLNVRRRHRISAGTIRAGSQPIANSRGQYWEQCLISAWIGNRPATNPVQAFLAFGDVSMLKPLLNEGDGTGLVFFCFGFLSSLPRRLLPFAISFSCSRVGRPFSGVYPRSG